MINSKYFFLHLTIILLLLSLSPSLAHKKRKGHPPTHFPPPTSPPPTTTASPPTPSPPQSNVSFQGSFSKVFAFGDSSTDTGNCFLLGGLEAFVSSMISHSFFGTTTAKKTTNRLCDGRLVIDFLSESLSLPYLTPYKESSFNFSSGVNFAISGTTSLSSDFFFNKKIGHNLMWKGIPQSCQTQIDWFNEFLKLKKYKAKSLQDFKAELTNSLFWVGDIGLNDYARIFGSPIPAKLITKLNVDQIFKIVQTLIDNGAKYIVVQGLPPAGCMPLQLSLSPKSDRDQMGCSVSANKVIEEHNELLLSKLAIFQKQYSQNCTIIYADYWNAYKTILANPKQYQIGEPFKACCGSGNGELNFDPNSLCGSSNTKTCKDPSKHISWDGIHLSEAMNKHMSDLLLKKGFCKPSFDSMIKIKKEVSISIGKEKSFSIGKEKRFSIGVTKGT